MNSKTKFSVHVGAKIHRWTVLQIAEIRKGWHKVWLCKCECGVTQHVLQSNLRRGLTKSCGCFKSEQLSINPIGKTHGESYSKEYRAWTGMISRCERPTDDSYKHYGGRGIRVCEEWRQSFPKFLEYVGRKPTLDHSIDRIDSDKNYEPGNVRWATQPEQRANQKIRNKQGRPKKVANVFE